MKRDRDDDEMEEWEEWIATDDGGFVRAERCADNRVAFFITNNAIRDLRDERGTKLSRLGAQSEPPPPAPGANYTNDALVPEARVQVKWEMDDEEGDEEAETVW